MPATTVGGEQVYYAFHRPVPAAQIPVVFIHGAGGSHQHWLYQVRALPHAITFAPDLPGHGRSAGAGKRSVQAYSDWLLEFLTAISLEQAVLVGHSMGGAIVMDLALRAPERVSALCLVATGARLRVSPAILDGLEHEPTTAVDLICGWAFGPDATDAMLRLGRRQMAATDPEVLHGDFVACDAFDVLDQVHEIAAPTLILSGTRDILTPSKYAIKLQDHIAGAELRLIEGAGHMIMIERPTAVSKAMTAFLAKL